MNNAAFGIVDFTRIALNESNYSNSFFLAPCFISNKKRDKKEEYFAK
jgi:hypothetical protein